MHGFVLAGIHIFSILAGFGIYALTRWGNQIAVQLPVAVLISISTFLGWLWVLDRTPAKRLNLSSREGLVGALLTSMVWAPVLFIPLHYFTQGYLTSIGNILAIWAFQLPVNIIIYFLVSKIAPRGEGYR
ncbi:MAG: hypothetical protein IBX69_19845 [Anaerolineales bacterium]|nr:hypothetical protein [Anaerolineales bacterium]